MTTLSAQTGDNRNVSVHRIDDVIALVLGRLLAFLLWVLSTTWKVEEQGVARLMDLTEQGKPVVAVFWHGNYLPLFVLARHRDVVVFTSRSFRGKVIASISRSFGYRPFLVPTGYAGFRTMLKTLQDERGARIAAVALDGPLGPYRKVKLAALLMASEIAGAIVPLGVRSEPALSMNNRWDGFQIPLPFARLSLSAGEPVMVPAPVAGNRAALKAVGDEIAVQLNNSS